MHTLSIWVAENISPELSKSLFVYDAKKNKINCSKFKKLFDIKNSIFFDEEHIYIVSNEIENGINIENLDLILDKYGFKEIYQDLKNKLAERNISHINYMVIAPDFEYAGKIHEINGIKFIDVFSYKFNDNFLDWLFNE